MLRQRALLLCLIILITNIGGMMAQTLITYGVYRGKNLYIQNPFNPDTRKYCITSVELNESVVLAGPEASAVQVDLSNLTLNDPVIIVVHHVSGCVPKFLNEAVLIKGTSFKFVQTLADDASITWVTTGEEPGDAGFYLEKKKLDGWELINNVHAKGNLDANQYSLGVEYYSGLNEFRLYYKTPDIQSYSEEFSFYSARDPISFFPVDDVENFISLSRSTDYVIKNMDGKEVMKGVGMDINVEGLLYGEYILIIENQEEQFYKPEPEKD